MVSIISSKNPCVTILLTFLQIKRHLSNAVIVKEVFSLGVPSMKINVSENTLNCEHVFTCIVGFLSVYALSSSI
jgi:hypothetical protein